MIDQIRQLGRYGFRPGTEHIDVKGCIDAPAWVRLNCESSPPELVFEDPATHGLEVRPATEAELNSIKDWLQANPPVPEYRTPAEVAHLLTAEEEDAIQANSRPLARELFYAIAPIPWPVVAAGMRQLNHCLLYTSPSPRD